MNRIRNRRCKAWCSSSSIRLSSTSMGLSLSSRGLMMAAFGTALPSLGWWILRRRQLPPPMQEATPVPIAPETIPVAHFYDLTEHVAGMGVYMNSLNERCNQLLQVVNELNGRVRLLEEHCFGARGAPGPEAPADLPVAIPEEI